MELLKNGKVTFGSESELARYCDDQRREHEKHNGWTNYATWRVNLECFDGYGEYLTGNGQIFDDVYALSEYLKESVYEMVNEYGEVPENSLAVSYADAFTSEVNYYEIAENLVEDNPKLIKGSTK